LIKAIAKRKKAEMQVLTIPPIFFKNSKFLSATEAVQYATNAAIKTMVECPKAK